MIIGEPCWLLETLEDGVGGTQYWRPLDTYTLDEAGWKLLQWRVALLKSRDYADDEIRWQRVRIDARPF